MRRPNVANLAVGLLLVFAGVAFGRQGSPVQVVTVRDTLAAAAYVAKLEGMRLQRDGFRARLEGIASRPPATIYVTDTLVTPPDTVFSFVSVRDGRLSSEMLITVQPGPDSVVNLARPELHAGSDISDCDEGFELSAAGVVCDRAVLGHLWGGPRLSKSPALGLWWEPSYRSPWSVEAWWLGGAEFDLAIRRGVRVF